MDLAQLLARDHDHLDRGIGLLVAPQATVEERQCALDAARISFAAHADAEATVLYHALEQVSAKQDVSRLVAQVLAAHRIQESILRRMDVRARDDDWTCATVRLRSSLQMHAEHEQATIMRLLRECVPVADFQRLAGAYASEKLRAIGLLSSALPVSRRVATRAPRRAMR